MHLSCILLYLKVVTFDYGMKTEDPIKKVLFYEKNSPNKAQKNLKVLEILLILLILHRVLLYRNLQCCLKPSQSTISGYMSKMRMIFQMPKGELN